VVKDKQRGFPQWGEQQYWCPRCCEFSGKLEEPHQQAAVLTAQVSEFG